MDTYQESPGKRLEKENTTDLHIPECELISIDQGPRNLYFRKAPKEILKGTNIRTLPLKERLCNTGSFHLTRKGTADLCNWRIALPTGIKRWEIVCVCTSTTRITGSCFPQLSKYHLWFVDSCKPNKRKALIWTSRFSIVNDQVNSTMFTAYLRYG